METFYIVLGLVGPPVAIGMLWLAINQDKVAAFRTSRGRRRRARRSFRGQSNHSVWLLVLGWNVQESSIQVTFSSWIELVIALMACVACIAYPAYKLARATTRPRSIKTEKHDVR